MVRHDAENVEIFGLSFQVNRQFVSDRSVTFFFGPGAMERAEQGVRTNFVQNFPILTDPVCVNIAAELRPLFLVLTQQKLGSRRGVCGKFQTGFSWNCFKATGEKSVSGMTGSGRSQLA